jgi:hypothetical protein
MPEDDDERRVLTVLVVLLAFVWFVALTSMRCGR